MRKRGPVDPDAIIGEVLAKAGKDHVDSRVLYDAAEALWQIGREDLAATYAGRAYGMALAERDAPAAARALTLMVSRLGPAGRKVMWEL